MMHGSQGHKEALGGKERVFTIALLFFFGLFTLFFFEEIVAYVQTTVTEDIALLSSLGRELAESASSNGYGAKIALFFGNALFAGTVLLSGSIYLFISRRFSRRHRLRYLTIATVTMFAALATMIVQASFCTGFSHKSVSMWMLNISEGLIIIEGIAVSLAPLIAMAYKRRKRKKAYSSF